MQVWLGEVFVQDKATGHKVALKLYDERVMAPVFTAGAQDSYTVAWNEAAAYKKMLHLQGKTVPNSYCHYKVSFNMPF